MTDATMIVVRGWTIYAHPLFLDQLTKLVAAVEKAKRASPDGYTSTANYKALASITKLAFNDIPEDPTRSVYRQGDTLGGSNKHWFRAKFGNGRYRLFFRFDTKAKILIYAWVNDQESLRTYGKKTDAYAVFKGMLDDGNPPNTWTELLQACSDKAAVGRLSQFAPAEARSKPN